MITIAVNLILLEQHEVGDDALVRLTGIRAQHVREVLRVKPNQHIQIGIVDGPRGTGTVLGLDGSEVTLNCEFESMLPARPAVDVMIALPRPKVMKRLWAQLAAIGVGRILLVNAARVERQYFDTHVLTPECYRPLLIEGLQQARDTRLPDVSIHRRLKVLVEDDLAGSTGEATRLIADPGARASVASALRAAGSAERCLVAVGPEGGWTDFERTLLGSHGFVAVSMRPRALRSDTACVALLTLVHEAMANGRA
jgi:RsmE family RNA methyltransferase